jgi:hypothetical protein
MITGIVFSNFVAVAKVPSPVGSLAGYVVPKIYKPVVPVYKQQVKF